MLSSPLNGAKVRLTTDIDRQQIIGKGRSAGDIYTLFVRVNGGNRRSDQAGTSHAGKPCQIDMDVTVTPHSFNKAWQHARIGRVDFTADQGGAQPGNRVHRE